jgi:hypothetical protein
MNSLKLKTFLGIELELIKEPSHDVKDLLSTTIYGMDGKMQYRHKNAEVKIDQLKDPHFVTLRQRKKLLGMVGLMYRRTFLNDTTISSFYVRYLSIIHKLKNNKSANKNKLKDDNKIYKSTIKSTISELMFEHASASLIQKDEPIVFYAFVDRDNLNSQNLCKKFGYKKIRQLSTLIFSRIFLKKSPHVYKLEESEKDFIMNKLTHEYQQYNLFFTDHVFLHGNYYVYKKDGIIVAGLKATKVEWDIVNIPDISGLIIKNIFPYLPLFSKLFNPKKFIFISFEAVWAEAGYENQLIELMESVCAMNNIHIGIQWLDHNSELNKRIRGTKKLGIINRLHKDVPADILAKFINMSDDSIKEFYDMPVYVSAFDLT